MVACCVLARAESQAAVWQAASCAIDAPGNGPRLPSGVTPAARLTVAGGHRMGRQRQPRRVQAGEEGGRRGGGLSAA